MNSLLSWCETRNIQQSTCIHTYFQTEFPSTMNFMSIFNLFVFCCCLYQSKSLNCTNILCLVVIAAKKSRN